MWVIVQPSVRSDIRQRGVSGGQKGDFLLSIAISIFIDWPTIQLVTLVTFVFIGPWCPCGPIFKLNSKTTFWYKLAPKTPQKATSGTKIGPLKVIFGHFTKIAYFYLVFPLARALFFKPVSSHENIDRFLSNFYLHVWPLAPHFCVMGKWPDFGSWGGFLGGFGG